VVNIKVTQRKVKRAAEQLCSDLPMLDSLSSIVLTSETRRWPWGDWLRKWKRKMGWALLTH
jgi:hypothetical protein